jgi:hypothetical protein
MTSQMMMTSERVVSPSTSQAIAGSGTQENDDISSPANHSLRLLEKARAFYQEPQQEKFLNLQAETESLLLRLQLMKQQRMDSIHD